MPHLDTCLGSGVGGWRGGWGLTEKGLFLSACFQAVRLSHTVLASAQNVPVVLVLGSCLSLKLGAEVDVGICDFLLIRCLF